MENPTRAIVIIIILMVAITITALSGVAHFAEKQPHRGVLWKT